MPAQDLIRMAFRPSDFQQLLELVDGTDKVVTHKLKAKWLEWQETHDVPAAPPPAKPKRTPSKRTTKSTSKVA